MVVSLLASFLSIIPIAFVIYKIANRSITRENNTNNEEKVQEARVAVPIVEVQTIQTEEIEIVEIKENIQGEEISHDMFEKRVREEMKDQEKYREALYHYCEERGEDPKNEDQNKKKQENKDQDCEIVLVYAV